jgi:hypothetical protein
MILTCRGDRPLRLRSGQAVALHGSDLSVHDRTSAMCTGAGRLHLFYGLMHLVLPKSC